MYEYILTISNKDKRKKKQINVQIHLSDAMLIDYSKQDYNAINR